MHYSGVAHLFIALQMATGNNPVLPSLSGQISRFIESGMGHTHILAKR